MLLYTERQLEEAYKIYRTHQVKKDLSFLSLENFRAMFEDMGLKLMEAMFNEIQHD